MLFLWYAIDHLGLCYYWRRRAFLTDNHHKKIVLSFEGLVHDLCYYTEIKETLVTRVLAIWFINSDLEDRL